jgi:DNA gyrase subunit A
MIAERPVEKEMRSSYIDYAMSVIIGRALPDARDGLKPVQRRVLYAMHENGWTRSKPTKKSASVVGEVLGKYHPHGDVSVYDSLVRLAQPFSMRYTLVEGQGNFGSMDGDSPAAMRYTECRLSRISEELLSDIGKETVEFMDNFDGSLKEPVVLPSRIPNLLVNGASGIAVGMATSMMPHNLTEVIDALVYLIDNPDPKFYELCSIIKGPDFPTGGIIVGRKGIMDSYATGRGYVVLRARIDLDQKRNRFIVKELPYNVNKANLVMSVADLAKGKTLEGISEIRDESNRKEGVRIVIELKRGANPDILLNRLFAHTQLQVKLPVINLAIYNNEPRLFSLKELLDTFISFREEIVTKRTRFDLRKAHERLEIVEGLMTALENIDRVIVLIRGSRETKEALAKLQEMFGLSERQGKAILEMRLQSLTSLERETLTEERSGLLGSIAEFDRILSDRSELLGVIRNELLEIREKYGDERRTEITEAEEDVNEEDLYEDRDEVILISEKDYVKRLPLEGYRAQKKGGVGLSGMGFKDEDSLKLMVPCRTKDWLLVFTTKGKVYMIKAYRMPEMRKQAKGLPIVNLLPLDENERICSVLNVRTFEGDLLFATAKGVVKKVALGEFSNCKITGKRAIVLREGDELIGVIRCVDKVMIATDAGMVVNFDNKKVREMGRGASGVRGIRLENSRVVSVLSIRENDESYIVTVTEKGYGKKTAYRSNYRETNRGCKGIKAINLGEKTGKLVAMVKAAQDDELMLATERGHVIRIGVAGISTQGRYARGVRLMKVKEREAVKNAVVLSA